MPRMTPDKTLDLEIISEKAAAMGRISSRLEEALTALRAFDAARAEPGAVARPGWRAEREELVATAAEWVWYFVVQREALGWMDHEQALRFYQVSDEVRHRMGPRRRPTPRP